MQSKDNLPVAIKVQTSRGLQVAQKRFCGRALKHNPEQREDE